MIPIRFKSSARLKAAPDCEAAAFEAELYNEVERQTLPARSGWYWRRLGSQGPWQGPFSIFGIAVIAARKASAEGAECRPSLGSAPLPSTLSLRSPFDG